MIVIVTSLLLVTSRGFLHFIRLHNGRDWPGLTANHNDEGCFAQDPGPDWNGLNSSSEAGLGTRDLETETAAEAETEAADPNNCDPKEHSSGDTAAQGGDPVAKAIEQRSYRSVWNLGPPHQPMPMQAQCV